MAHQPLSNDKDEFSINPSDFVSTQLSIELFNNTTRTRPRSDTLVKLVQFLTNGMVLEIPAKSCAHGHNLSLKIRATLPNKSILEFDSTAKVDSHENLDPECDEIAITLVQFDAAKWNALTQSFASRQAEIENFFAAVKGF
jgi:hypothetical protein